MKTRNECNIELFRFHDDGPSTAGGSDATAGVRSSLCAKSHPRCHRRAQNRHQRYCSDGNE